MPRDAAPGLTLACGVIPSGSNPIEIRCSSGQPHRRGVRARYAFDGAGSVGGRVKSHCSRNVVCLQCDLCRKPGSRRAISTAMERCKRTTLECPCGTLERCMEPVVRARCWLRPHEFVSSADGSEVRCAHFPAVAYPIESDEPTDPMRASATRARIRRQGDVKRGRWLVV